MAEHLIPIVQKAFDFSVTLYFGDVTFVMLSPSPSVILSHALSEAEGAAKNLHFGLRVNSTKYL